MKERKLEQFLLNVENSVFYYNMFACIKMFRLFATFILLKQFVGKKILKLFSFFGFSKYFLEIFLLFWRGG